MMPVLEWTIQTYVELVFQNCRIIICIDRPDPSIVSEWPYKEHFCGTFNEISKLIIVEVRVVMEMIGGYQRLY